MNSFRNGVVALSGTWPRALSGGLALRSLGHFLGFHHSASESVAHAMRTNLANLPDLFSAQWDCPHGAPTHQKEPIAPTRSAALALLLLERALDERARAHCGAPHRQF
jgi:hypothetical protein